MAVPKVFQTEAFADYIESITLLYLVDDKFRGICDDYAMSISKAERYRKRQQEAEHSTSEYESVSQELEKDILRYLTEKKRSDG